MLTHRWKKLGLSDPVSGNKNEHTREQSHKKKQLAKKNCLLKMNPIRARQSQRENTEKDVLHRLSSNISEAGLLEGKVSDTHSLNNMSGSSECHTDSDVSDQEQESIEMSKWAAAVELDLKPEPFDEDLDHCSTETAFYPEVLPASLDSTQSLSSENLDVTETCLDSVIARLMEIEKLQAATVEKEKAKLARSRPATANTQNSKRLRKSDFPGCKTGVSRDAECNSVVCSFTKLTVSPNSSCRCRHPTCPKPGRGSKGKLPHPTLLKCPDSMSGKCKTAETGFPNFSVNVKVPQKPTLPNRTKSLTTHRSSTSAKKPTVPKLKT
ncbi:protein FAM217A [Tachysurus fulvidraco]|uniref:protein FAM217A n=1 Tax=Tachysurus fulvidraco TaxID=1234273 RepID=UPI001FEF1346|nr:protein FAM217A [Tachysurus fulvidraco]XP_047657121.1 protein FAM217A [Tachysurus fulvidraco]